jgi:4-hydroxy-3-polyprenylbenzoate decarboxylase
MAPMPHRCLAEFLEELRNAGELSRIDDETDPAFRVAEMALESAKSGGPALLFGIVKGHNLPILCNLLATEGRICRALGSQAIDEVSDRIARLFDTSGPEGWFERLKGGGRPATLASVAPRKIKSAAVQQIVRLGSDLDLGELPLLQMIAYTEKGDCPNFREHRQVVVAENETVPFAASEKTIPSAIVFSAEPDSHRPVSGRFDVLRIDRTRLAVCWADYDEHARLLAEYRERDQKMPLAVAIGGDPAFLLASAAPLPPGSDICAAAGLLREKPLDVVACRSIDLDMPAEAEIVLEGFVEPKGPTVMAGPLCGPMGHLSPPRPAVVMQVTAVTHRANPIFAVMILGRPPHESVTAARAMHRVFLPLARIAMPELVDYDLPEFAAARYWAAVSIRKTYPGQGQRAAHVAWNLPALSFAKVLVVVDADVDVHDQQAVLAAVAANLRPGRDVLIQRGPADPYDPAMPTGELGEKMAIDATRKT